MEKLREFTNKITDIQRAIAILNWDQETYMPKKGQGFRAQQIGTLSGLAHEIATSKAYEECLLELKDKQSLSAKDQRNVLLLLKDFEKAKKLPSEFVIRLSKTTSKAFHAWVEARQANDFKVYEKALTEMVNIQQEKAKIYGYEGHVYNALMDDYQPEATVDQIDKIFADAREKLQPLIAKIAKSKQVNDKFMYQHFGKDEQWNLGIALMKKLGYDMDAGRQDLAEHPFSTTFSPGDVRVTTRIDEQNFYDMLWSCMHECGHALYEQGLLEDQYGLPCGEAVSLGIHESQSRFYENNLGRSKAFWMHNYKDVVQAFPVQFNDVTLNDFYQAINIVKPSLIRTDADELTYHFHIMIRYELEKMLIEGSLKVSDVRDAWNEKYKSYLNIDVPSDAKGVLQDIHWSHGGFGYFPTYSLGSFYAAQFEAKMREDITEYDEKVGAGNYAEILHWLRKNIHEHGRFYSSEDLCKQATGEGLNFKYFMNYAEKKYGEIYSV